MLYRILTSSLTINRSFNSSSIWDDPTWPHILADVPESSYCLPPRRTHRSQLKLLVLHQLCRVVSELKLSSSIMQQQATTGHSVRVRERQVLNDDSRAQQDPDNHLRKMQLCPSNLLQLNVVMGWESFYKLQGIW